MSARKILVPLLLVAVIGIVALVVTAPRKTAVSPKTYHVGILSGLDLFIGISDSFKAEMTNLGYVDGSNIIYDFQKTNYEPEKEKQILNKFVTDHVDLIFGYNTEVALAAKESARGSGIPVLFANALTEGSNLIDSLRTPGGNITGVRYPNIDVATKRLEVLHEIVPGAKRFWLPYQSGYPSVNTELEAVRPAAKKLGLDLIEFPARDLSALQAELQRRAATKDLGFDAVLFIPEPLSTKKDAFAAIAKYTRERKIPIGGSSVLTDDYGAVFAITMDNVEVGKLAASMADKILRQGIPAGTIPVVSPETKLILNSKVAAELGIPLPEGLLYQANEIIR